ncbi:MAG: hypothetical protein C0514_02900 [Candidatus Puniceispirillum sp.]|nr:hypothetical protein [Candidatus Puniceispirillum sp.]
MESIDVFIKKCLTYRLLNNSKDICMRMFFHFFAVLFLLNLAPSAKVCATCEAPFDKETLQRRVTTLYETYSSLINTGDTYHRGAMDELCDQKFTLTFNNLLMVDGIEAFHKYIQTFKSQAVALHFSPFYALLVDPEKRCVALRYNVMTTSDTGAHNTRNVAAFLYFNDQQKLTAINEVVFTQPPRGSGAS